MSRVRCLIFLVAFSSIAGAQFQMLNSGSTASLRGVHAVNRDVAWASGTEGTVLKTEDGGETWARCATPAGAEKLDFRGVQAFDAKNALVMSSGKGGLSRIYKTMDGCRTWALAFTNPDAEGFFDAIQFWQPDKGYILGDPVAGHFVIWNLAGHGKMGDWLVSQYDFVEKKPMPDYGGTAPLMPLPHESSFAASNSSLMASGSDVIFATGGGTSPRIAGHFIDGGGDVVWFSTKSFNVPMKSGPSAGIFSFGVRLLAENCAAKGEVTKWFNEQTSVPSSGMSCKRVGRHFVMVGGDYTKPDLNDGNAAYGFMSYGGRGEETWQASQTRPHGYRSSVVYDVDTKTWITVGPNGTDVSTDDGRNWRALRPAKEDAQDADKNWNALSLPFVVGPKGRIGKLRDGVLRLSSTK